MKRLLPAAIVFLGLVSCVSTPPSRIFNARLYTVDNQEIVLRDLKLWEKNYQIESQEFHPRWRQSLEKVNLDFGAVASAENIGGEEVITRVQFQDGREDDFNEFFVDEYNLKGWSEYGPFEISATLVRGLVFLDEALAPVRGAVKDISPVVYAPGYLDRFVSFQGDIISGDVVDEQLKVKTDYGLLTINIKLIEEIHIDRETDTLKEIVRFKNGDVISGLVDPPQLQMKLVSGQMVTMNFDQLSRVLFGRPVAKEEEE